MGDIFILIFKRITIYKLQITLIEAQKYKKSLYLPSFEARILFS